MANGYIGKILRVNLTTRKSAPLTPPNTRIWGGYGMGTAIFWDLAVALENGI